MPTAKPNDWTRYFRRRRVLQRPEAAPLELRSGARGVETVLPRGAWLHRRFDLAGVPPAHRRRLLDTRIERWSPFPAARRHVVLAEDHAQVWILKPGHAPADAEVLPESLFRGEPRDDGVELLRVSDGVEGRVWRNGQLLASRHWRTEPGHVEWAAFLRGVGRLGDLEPPALVEAPIRNQAWTHRPLEELKDLVRSEKHLATAAMTVLGAVLVWQLVALAVTERDLRQLELRYDDRYAELGNILEASGEARRIRRFAERVAAAQGFPSQLELMASVQDLLHPGATLNAWEFDGSSVTVSLSNTSWELPEYVRAFEERFDGVTADNVRGGIVSIRMQTSTGDGD
jgi:hypothetical protein